MGSVKTGGNYAAALAPIMNARAAYQADQVLFLPGRPGARDRSREFHIDPRG